MIKKLTGEHGVKTRWLRWLCEQTLCRITHHRCHTDTNPYGESVCIDCSHWLSWKEADRAMVIER